MHLSIRTALATAVKTIMPFAKTNAYMFRAILAIDLSMRPLPLPCPVFFNENARIRFGSGHS